MKIKALHISTALALALGSGAASAFGLPPGGVDGSGRPIAGAQLQDDNIDFFIDNDNDNLLSVGDQLISPIEIASINDILASNGSQPAQNLDISKDELVALATITVKSLTPGGGGFSRIDFGSNADNTPILQFFNLDSAGDKNLDLEGAATPFVNCTNQATCTAATTDGNPWASFDIVDADDEWFFNPASGFETIADNPGAVANLPASTKVGAVNYALSLVAGTNNSGFEFLDQYIGCLAVPDGVFQCGGNGETILLGSADILGGLGLPATLGAFARSDADAQLNVPEPSLIALLGMGLLGIGAARKRKNA